MRGNWLAEGDMYSSIAKDIGTSFLLRVRRSRSKKFHASVCNAACPVGRGRRLNSRSRHLSGHSGTQAMAAPTTGPKVCRHSRSPARGKAAPGRQINRGRRHSKSKADRMSAGQGLQLELPTPCGRSRCARPAVRRRVASAISGRSPTRKIVSPTTGSKGQQT